MHPSSFRSFCAFCLLIPCLAMTAHVHAQCNPLGMPPGNDCTNAAVTCLQNACYSLTDLPGIGPANWCGVNTQINNPQYFKVVANQDFISVTIHVDQCHTGNEIQAALIEACPWTVADVLDCHPGSAPGGSLFISANVVPGNMYWIVVDGTNGAICDYSFTEVEGVEEIDIPDELTAAETNVEPAPLCQGYNNAHFFTGPLLEQAHGYYWVFSWGNDTISTTFNELFWDIPNDLAPGEYSFCVAAFNGCDTTDTVCKTFEVMESDTVEKYSVLCPEDFPFVWGNSNISDPGIYLESFEDPLGCRIDTIWEIESYPVSSMDTTTVIICEPDDTTLPGYYTLEFPDADVNGCDSIHTIHVVTGNISTLIDISCEAEEYILSAIVEELGHPNDALTYSWYSCTSDTLLDVGPMFVTPLAGCYRLITTGMYCQDTAFIEFEQDLCMDECGIADDHFCNGDTVVFMLPWAVSKDAEIDWFIQGPDQYQEIVQDVTVFSRIYITPGLYEISLQVSDTGHLQTCVDFFQVDPVPIATVCCDQTICDSCAIITIQANDFVDVVLSDQAGGKLFLQGVPTFAEFEYCNFIIPGELTITHVSSTFSGCIGEPEFPDQVTITRSPEIEIFQNDASLCIETINPVAITWHACGDTTPLAENLCFEPAQSGCYCVSVTDANLCSRSDCYEFISNQTKDALGHGFTLFPNPSNDRVSVTIPNHIQLPVEWILYDTAGKMVTKGKWNDAMPQFEWPRNVASGRYEMVIREVDASYRLRLVRK